MRRIIASTRRTALTASRINVVSVGERVDADNSPTTVPLPPEWSAGNLFFTCILFSTPTGVLSTPPGWTLLANPFNADGEIRLYVKIAENGDTNPTFEPSGGSAGDGILGATVALSGVDTVDPIAVLGPDTITTEQVSNIPVTAPDVSGITSGAVIFCGARNAGFASTSPLSGNGLTWREIWDFSSGNRGTHLAGSFASWDGSVPSLTDKTFVLTGDRTGTTYGKAIVFRPSFESIPAMSGQGSAIAA